MKVNTCVFCNFDLPLVDEVNYKELFKEHLEHIKREEEQTMTNNWKEKIIDVLGKHYNDIFYGEVEPEKQNDGVINFIESLLAEQKKELLEEYKERIQKYKSYYNPVGDELNKGKHIACDDLLESLNHHD